MIKLMLELIKLFTEKKMEKLSVYDNTMYMRTEYGGHKYDISVTLLPEGKDDVQV